MANLQIAYYYHWVISYGTLLASSGSRLFMIIISSLERVSPVIKIKIKILEKTHSRGWNLGTSTVLLLTRCRVVLGFMMMIVLYFAFKLCSPISQKILGVFLRHHDDLNHHLKTPRERERENAEWWMNENEYFVSMKSPPTVMYEYSMEAIINNQHYHFQNIYCCSTIVRYNIVLYLL